MQAPSQAVRREHEGTPAKAPATRAARGVAAGMPEFLRRDDHTARDDVRVQRQEDTESSSFQLTPPSLLQPPPAPSFFGDQFQLKLDPAIQAHVVGILTGGLRPEHVQHGLLQLNPGGGGAARPQGAGDVDLDAAPIATAPAPAGPDLAGPVEAPAAEGTPPSPPIVPEGSYPAGFGVWYALVMSMPQVQAAAGELSAHGRRISDDLGTGGLIGMGIAMALASATAVVPLSMDPRYRDPVLRAGWDALNGSVLPIPGTPAHAEFSLSGDNFVIGLHLDMAPFFPEWFGLTGRGFIGPGSLMQPLPAMRSARHDALPAVDAPAIVDAIRSAAPGTPLPADVRRSVQHATGVDLSDVAVHTDQRADELTRALDATAFAAGADLFFRTDAYDPGSAAGRRLIAHEAAHAAQQRRSRVDGVELGAGLRVNRPGDAHERDADDVASSIEDGSLRPRAQGAGVAATAAGALAVQRQAGMTSGEAPMSVPAPEANASYPREETRYTLMLTSGTQADLTEEQAIAALNDVYHETNLEFELGSGEHKELKKARDGNLLIGVGGYLSDLFGDDLPPLSIWTPAGNHLGAARGALGAGNVEDAAASLRAAHDAYLIAAARYNAYLDQLEEAADFATVAIVIVAVLAVAVAVGAFVAGTTAAAGATATGATATGTSATGATATGATATGATATGATATGATATGATATGATATGATATGATATGATAAGAQVSSSVVLQIIETVAANMGNPAALHAYLMKFAATSAGRATLLAAARVAAAVSLQPGVTRAEFQMLKQVSELLFTFARGGK